MKSSIRQTWKNHRQPVRRAWAEMLESRRLLSTTWYVDVHSPTSFGNGLSWNGAFRTLQSAISDASSGDTIHVADGTYSPGTGTTTSVTYTLKNGVTIQGGYAGYGASNPDARDINANKTILSGFLSTSGSVSYYAEHVVTGTGCNSTAVLDGVTITQGLVLSSVGGAGLYDNSGSPTISNCTFDRNSGQGEYLTNYSASGGAVYNYSSSPTFSNCNFIDNQASTNGGAVYDTNSSSPTFTSCQFLANYAQTNGGAVDNANSSAPKFTNCTISRNVGHGSGGGIANDTTSPAVFSGCTISLNTSAEGSSTQGGGGVYNSNSAAKFTNCIFLNNSDSLSSNNNGGAVFATGTASPSFIQCMFDGNQAAVGAAIYSTSGAAPAFTNCTFSANNTFYSTGHGEVIYQNSTASAVFVNCILYGNTGIDPTPIYTNAGTVNITYSDVQGGATGAGNLNVDPIFTNPAGPDGVAGNEDDDFRLRPSSPVADDGNNNATGLTGITTDLAGAPRFADIPTAPDTGVGAAPLVDMGAYEASPGMIADAYGPYSVAAGGTVTLKSYGYSPQTGSLAFAWDFNNDGNYDDATGSNPTFSAAGMTIPATITVSVQITDSLGRTTTASAILKVIPQIIYVDDSAPGANNGGSWTDAYRSLADAMNDALPGDQILVAQGTYYATDNTNNWWDSLVMKNGEHLIGGYAGYGASNPNARNVSAYPTILSGDIGTTGDITDNTNQILRAVNVDNTTLIDGLTFTLGNAWSYLGDAGAALYVYLANPTIQNCTFTSNTGELAPVFVHSSSSAISNCLFKLNSALFYGGALEIDEEQDAPSIPTTVTDCIFDGNTAVSGGAVYDYDGSHKTFTIPIFEGCTFAGNVNVTTPGFPGGSAIYIAGTAPTIANSIFWGNYFPAGVFSSVQGNSPTFTNCLGDYTGYPPSQVDPKFIRNPSRGADSVWGTADDDLGDLHLQSTSPAIDAGSNTYVPSGTTLDFDGNPRFVDITGIHDPGVIVDIGPYEYTATLAATSSSFKTPPTATSIQVVFNQNIDPASVQGGDLTLSNLSTGQNISGSTVTAGSYNAATYTAIWTFNNALPDGNYHVAITNVTDAADHSNSTNTGVDFFILNGDSNHDRTVNSTDFGFLAANFGKTGVGLRGDFNFDGTVNALDFNALATNYGANLAASGAAIAESIAPEKSFESNLFSSTPVVASANDSFGFKSLDIDDQSPLDVI